MFTPRSLKSSGYCLRAMASAEHEVLNFDIAKIFN